MGNQSKPKHMESINKLQLLLLLQDTIVHYKHGMRLSRNSAQFKAMFCESVGLPRNTKSEKLLSVLGHIYDQNGMRDKFISTCTNHGLIVNF
jgi:hypothetical protein